MDLSSGQRIARWILVALNILFVLCGLGVLVVGCILRFGLHLIVGEYIEPLVNHASAGAISDIDLSSLVNGVAIALIIIGVVILAIGCLGFFGSCCLVKILLVVYGVCVVLLVIVEVIAIAVFFGMKAEIDKTFKTYLKTSLQNDYGGESASDGISIAWNFAFIELDCCGVDNYTDLHLSTKWQGPALLGPAMVTPITCCRLSGEFPNYVMPTDYTCAQEPLSEMDSNFQIGCYEQLQRIVESESAVLIAVGIVVVVIEMIVIIAAFCLCRATEGSKVY